MSFYKRNYPSVERFSLEKYLNFNVDCYDVIDSSFLNRVKLLPVTQYYDVNMGYKEIDLISNDVYGTPFYAFLILYFNDLSLETIPEGTTLKLFSLNDLSNLDFELSNQIS